MINKVKYLTMFIVISLFLTACSSNNNMPTDDWALDYNDEIINILTRVDDAHIKYWNDSRDMFLEWVPVSNIDEQRLETINEIDGYLEDLKAIDWYKWDYKLYESSKKYIETVRWLLDDEYKQMLDIWGNASEIDDVDQFIDTQEEIMSNINDKFEIVNEEFFETQVDFAQRYNFEIQDPNELD